MKIAIANNGINMADHFGHCEGFTIVEIENSEVVKKNFTENPGHKPGFLPNYLNELGVKTIIAGGMGAGAQEIFASKNIEVFSGISGEVEDVIKLYISNKLKSANTVCKEHSIHDC